MKLKKLRVYLLSAAIAASLAAGGTGVFADEITATPDSEVLELESAGEGDLQDSYDEELPGDEESYEGDTEDEFLEIAEEAYDGDDSEFLDIEIAATTVENAEEEEELTGSEQGDIGEVHWELSDLGVLEFTGTGAIRDYDDASAVPWAASAASVKTVSISGDISGIGNNALAKLENLTEVQMNDKVLSIGERAFSGDVKLGYITIPATTANIGKDAFAGHMENFYIKGSFHSKAEEYAAGNSIRFVPASTTSIATADISGIPASAAYTGAEIRPEVTVKINLTTLKIFDDYKVTYTNNTNVGTASVTIEGVGAYNGTVLKTFSIVGASIQGAQITGFINKVYDGSPKTQDISVILNGKTLSLNADYTISYAINVNGVEYNVTVEAAAEGAAPAAAPAPAAPAAAPAPAAPAGGKGSVEVTASLPGKVFKVEAAAGQAVKAGDPIVILEAMKMEVPVVAPQDGTIASINVAAGQSVEAGTLLATMN